MKESATPEQTNSVFGSSSFSRNQAAKNTGEYHSTRYNQLSRSSELSRKLVSQRMQRNCKENFIDGEAQQPIRASQNLDQQKATTEVVRPRKKDPNSLFTINPTRAVHNWQSNLDREIEAGANERQFSKNLSSNAGFCNPAIGNNGTSGTELRVSSRLSQQQPSNQPQQLRTKSRGSTPTSMHVKVAKPDQAATVPLSVLLLQNQSQNVATSPHGDAKTITAAQQQAATIGQKIHHDSVRNRSYHSGNQQLQAHLSLPSSAALPKQGSVGNQTKVETEFLKLLDNGVKITPHRLEPSQLAQTMDIRGQSAPRMQMFRTFQLEPTTSNNVSANTISRQQQRNSVAVAHKKPAAEIKGETATQVINTKRSLSIQEGNGSMLRKSMNATNANCSMQHLDFRSTQSKQNRQQNNPNSTHEQVATMLNVAMAGQRGRGGGSSLEQKTSMRVAQTMPQPVRLIQQPNAKSVGTTRQRALSSQHSTPMHLRNGAEMAATENRMDMISIPFQHRESNLTTPSSLVPFQQLSADNAAASRLVSSDRLYQQLQWVRASAAAAKGYTQGSRGSPALIMPGSAAAQVGLECATIDAQLKTSGTSQHLQMQQLQSMQRIMNTFSSNGTESASLQRKLATNAAVAASQSLHTPTRTQHSNSFEQRQQQEQRRKNIDSRSFESTPVQAQLIQRTQGSTSQTYHVFKDATPSQKLLATKDIQKNAAKAVQQLVSTTAKQTFIETVSAQNSTIEKDSSQKHFLSKTSSSLSAAAHQSNRVEQPAATSNQQRKGSNGFTPNSIPSTLKKQQQASQSMDRYLRSITGAKPAGMTSSQSLENCREAGGGSVPLVGPSKNRSSMTITSHDDLRESSLNQLDRSEQQPIQMVPMRSLEVLEERSNEDNSPQIKQIKAGMAGNLSHVISGDSNFIYSGKKSRRQSFSNGLLTLNEITLTNQKQEQHEQQQQPLEIGRCSSFKLIGQPVPQTVKTPVKPIKMTQEMSNAMHLSFEIIGLQNQMNSGVFMGGSGGAHQASTTAAHAHQHQSSAQTTGVVGANHQLQMPGSAPQKQVAAGVGAGAAHQAGSSADQPQPTENKNVIYVDQATYQQLQQQAASGGGHANAHGMTLRQVSMSGSGGQMQPPHLSQQAQQMLHSKLQIQQNAAPHSTFRSSQAHVQSAQQQQQHHHQQLQYQQHQQQQQTTGDPQTQMQRGAMAQSQKVGQYTPQQTSGHKFQQRGPASANQKKGQQQQSQQVLTPKQQKYMMAQQQQQQLALQQTTSPNGVRPGSNHRVLVPAKQGVNPQQHQAPQQQQIQQLAQQMPPKPQTQHAMQHQSHVAVDMSAAAIYASESGARQATANSQSAADQNAISSLATVTAATGAKPESAASTSEAAKQGLGQTTDASVKQPRTYKEIKQRLQQLQQMQYLRQQQQQWIQRQQQILLANNPGATIEQVNAIIQQSILNQQQQMALQQQQAHIIALQQVSQALQQQTAMAQQQAQEQAAAQQQQQQVAGSASQQTKASTSGQDEESKETGGQPKIGKRSAASVSSNTTMQGGRLTINQPGQNSSTLAWQAGGPNQRSALVNSQQQLPLAAASGDQLKKGVPSVKDDTLMSYAQILKQECQYDGAPWLAQLSYKPNREGQNLQPTNMPQETLKHSLQQVTSEILRKVLARSDSMNQLRQIIDLKAKKVKPKNYESSIFVTILDKEQQRVTQEGAGLAKNVLRIEDKSLIKYLRGQVKKMLKPFKGLIYDDFLNNEIHLNEIMATQDQVNDPIKESRKRHLRILEAALKEQVVDIQIVLGICVQISRQAFYNELQEYFICAYDYIMANQTQFQQHDIQGIVNLKKKLGSVRSHSKVQIQTNKKLDRMFWLLLEQNQEVKNNIRTYKERFNEKAEHGGMLMSSAADVNGTHHLNSANYLHRRQANTLRSSSGVVGTASPKVQAGGSSHNVFNHANGQTKTDGSARRQIQKGSRGSNHQQDTFASNANKQLITNQAGANNKMGQVSQSHEAADFTALHSTASKAQQLLNKTAGKNHLAPLSSNGTTAPGKKAQSLIQKKMKARDLDRQLNSQQPTPNVFGDKTSEQSNHMSKKRMSSTKHQQTSQMISSQHTSATPQTFHPRSRTKQLNAINSTNLYSGQREPGHSGTSMNNSTENLFNLIQATKTKNAVILEPLSKRHKKTDSVHGGREQTSTDLVSREEIGSGLQAHGDEHNGPLSQKSHRMRQTDYTRGFMSNLEVENASADMNANQVLHHKKQMGGAPEVGSPSKVFRSWSRPQINSAEAEVNEAHGNTLVNANGKIFKTMQVCTCGKFRKRIEPPSAGIPGINIGSLDQKSPINQTSSQLDTKAHIQLPLQRNQAESQQHQQPDQVRQGSRGAPSDGAFGNTKLSSSNPSQGDDSVSPSKLGGQPRASQDFKMRILTKKKVTVPPSATSQQSRCQYSMGQTSQTSIDQQQQLRKGGVFPHGSAAEDDIDASGPISSADMAGGSGIVLQRSKIVTYELCQECGGQRPAGLPQVKSSLSEVKVKLAIGKVTGYQSDEGSEEGEFQGTARLNDSRRSSTLSLGDRSSGSRRRRGRPAVTATDQVYLSSNVYLGRVVQQQVEKLGDKLNRRHLQTMGSAFYPGLQEWVAVNRATRIQIFYKERFAERAMAAQIIQERWHLCKLRRDQGVLIKAKLHHLRKKVAINRIYDFYRMIKVKKVMASALLVQHHLRQIVQQACEQYGQSYIEKIVQIQQKWRSILSRRYRVGRSIVAKKEARQKIFASVIGQKYYRLQCSESASLYHEMMFAREHKNLEVYFWKQKVNYAKDLETRAAKIEQRQHADFGLADWNLDATTREWQNTSKSITIKLEKHEASSITVLRDRLVQFYVSNQLPNEQAVERQLDDLLDGRNAIQKALKKEQDYKRRHMLQRIKRQRLHNLFAEELDISGDQHNNC